jgi:Rho termination factor-like protein
MPGNRYNSIKDPELYEELRDEGNSKQKAARISNAAAARGRSAVGRAGGKSGDMDDWTVAHLRSRAKELGISGYSGKKKAELIKMIRNS